MNICWCCTHAALGFKTAFQHILWADCFLEKKKKWFLLKTFCKNKESYFSSLGGHQIFIEIFIYLVTYSEPHTGELSCWFDLDYLMRYIMMLLQQTELGRTNASSHCTKVSGLLQKQQWGINGNIRWRIQVSAHRINIWWHHIPDAKGELMLFAGLF